MISGGTKSPPPGSPADTVPTDVTPPLKEPPTLGITSDCARANEYWRAASAGPAASVIAAITIAPRGKLSVIGRPRPPGRPIARAPATIHSTQVTAPARPIRP